THMFSFSFPSFAAILGLYLFIIRFYQQPIELTICISGIIRNFGEMQKAESGDFNTRASVVVNAVVSAHCPFGPSLALMLKDHRIPTVSRRITAPQQRPPRQKILYNLSTPASLTQKEGMYE